MLPLYTEGGAGASRGQKSRGDVQPSIALAQELEKIGIRARIATNGSFQGLLNEYGIEHFPIGVDFESAGIDPEMIKKAQQADNVLKMLFTFRKMRDYAVLLVEEYYAACEVSQAIVSCSGPAGAASKAALESFRICRLP